MSINSTANSRGPFDAMFRPGAARPAGSQKNGGRLVLADDAVLLRSDVRDKMVQNPEQRDSRSDQAHRKAAEEASRAYESTFKTMQSADDKFKLARLEDTKTAARMQVEVDQARVALGKYTAVVAGDYRLEPRERDQQATLDGKLDAKTKALDAFRAQHPGLIMSETHRPKAAVHGKHRHKGAVPKHQPKGAVPDDRPSSTDTKDLGPNPKAHSGKSGKHRPKEAVPKHLPKGAVPENRPADPDVSNLGPNPKPPSGKSPYSEIDP